MAITSNKSRNFRNLEAAAYDELPVATSSSIYQGALIAMNGSGYVAHAADSASVTGVGVASQEVDNSLGSNGDKTVKVYTSGEWSLPVTGTVAYGDPVFANGDEKVAASGSLAANGVFIGHAMEADDENASNRWIRLDGPRKTGFTFPT